MEAKALRSWVDLEAKNRAMPKKYAEEAEQEKKEQFELILRDLHSWIDVNLMWDIHQERPLKIYWGTATTGRPHLGYFVPMYKVADYLKAGCDVTILFADLHGFLDNMKSSWELLEHRCNFYRLVIKEMLKLIGVDVTGEAKAGLGTLKFVRGSSYQLERDFTLDVYKMSVKVTTGDTTRAGAEVVKQQTNPLMSNLLYPIMQALDEEHLGCDIQFGGVDQRKIFMFSRDHSSKLGYKKRGYLMNPLIPGLGKSGKMSSSEPLSKIDFNDSKEALSKKVRMAFCRSPVEVEEGESAEECMNNGILAICKFILFRFLEDAPDTKPGLTIGENHYETYEALAKAFKAGIVHPSALKPVFAEALEKMLAPMRKVITTGEGLELLKKGYPDVAKQMERDEKARAASLAGPKTIACANLVVAEIADVEEQKPGVFFANAKIGGDKQVAVASPYLKANTKIVVCTNFGPVYHKGVKGEAPALAAGKKGQFVLLAAPENSAAGDVVSVEGFAPAPDDTMGKKTWPKIKAKLKVNADGVAEYDGTPLQVNGQSLPAVDEAKGQGCALRT